MTLERISLEEVNAAQTVESAVLKLTHIYVMILFCLQVFGVLSFRQEDVALFVIKLNITVSHVSDEPSIDWTSIFEPDTSTVFAPAAIIIPGSFINVLICVVMSSGVVAHILFELAFVILAIRKQNLGLSIKDFPAIESTLNDLIREAKEQSKSMRFPISPFTFVNSSIRKPASTYTMPKIIFESSFIFASGWVDNLTLTVF